jgi:hypothetical protein
MSVDSVSSIPTEEIKPKDKGSMKCAPAIKFSAGSCINLPILIEMARAYNKVNDNQIMLHDRLETLNPKKYKTNPQHNLSKSFESRNEAEAYLNTLRRKLKH